jgi:AcrR family transcriptional regulator
MTDASSTRRYVSKRRAESARQTRRAILAAARELFVHQGYTATTVEQIAARAGVSKPTVFASVGNKRAVFVMLRDTAIAGDDAPEPIARRAWFREALDEPDPARSVRLHARNVVRLHRQAGDLNEVLRTGAGADAELRELWLTAERQRRADAATFVASLATKVPLKNGLDNESATDLVWAFTSADTFQRLVRIRRWSLTRYEQWLGETFADQLLPLEHRSPGAAPAST